MPRLTLLFWIPIPKHLHYIDMHECISEHECKMTRSTMTTLIVLNNILNLIILACHFKSKSISRCYFRYFCLLTRFRIILKTTIFLIISINNLNIYFDIIKHGRFFSFYDSCFIMTHVSL